MKLRIISAAAAAAASAPLPPPPSTDGTLAGFGGSSVRWRESRFSLECVEGLAKPLPRERARLEI